MLSLIEEAFLRKQIRDNTPLQVVNPHPPQTESAAEQRILEKQINSLPKMKVADPNEDWGIINLVSHTMKKGEALLAWYARIGLGRGQIVTMSRSEISKFVETVERNSAEEVRPPQASMGIAPDAKPQKRTAVLVG
jgi:hypothetical protein